MPRELKPIVDENGNLALTIAQIKSRYKITKDNHIAFAMAYISDPRRNASRTYARVYHKRNKPTPSDQCNSSILLNADHPVGKFVNDLDTGIANVIMRKNIISKEQVLQELIKVGFSDIGDLYDEENNLLNVADMQTDVTPAIRKVKEKVLSKKLDDTTGEEQTVLQREIEMHDKKGALQLIGQHLQMFVQKGEIEVKSSVDDLIKDITANNAQNRKSLLPKDNADLPPIEGEKNE